MEGYNPYIYTSLLEPINYKLITDKWFVNLYHQTQLTQDELTVLDYIGASSKIKGSKLISISFQGLKRLTYLHQAKLTKALNRLEEKNFIIKSQEGYMLTHRGIDLFEELMKNENYSKRYPKQIISHVATGCFLNEIKNMNDLREKLSGKWFGDFRYVSIVEYTNSFEINWISTSGDRSICLNLGPNNNIRITYSANQVEEYEFIENIESLIKIIRKVSNNEVNMDRFKVYKNSKMIHDKIYPSYAS